MPGRKPWIVPFPGTTRRHRLTENLGAAGELNNIEEALAAIEVQGARYPAHRLKKSGADPIPSATAVGRRLTGDQR